MPQSKKSKKVFDFQGGIIIMLTNMNNKIKAGDIIEYFKFEDIGKTKFKAKVLKVQGFMLKVKICENQCFEENTIFVHKKYCEKVVDTTES